MISKINNNILARFDKILIPIALISILIWTFTENIVFIMVIFYSTVVKFLMISIDRYLQKDIKQSIVNLIYAICLFIVHTYLYLTVLSKYK